MKTIGKREQSIELTTFSSKTSDVKALHQTRNASTETLLNRMKNFLGFKYSAKSSVDQSMRKGTDSLTEMHRSVALSSIKATINVFRDSVKQLLSEKIPLPPKTISSDGLVTELERLKIDQKALKPSLLKFGVSEEILKNTFAYLDQPPAHLTKENVQLIKSESTGVFFEKSVEKGFDDGLDALNKELDKKIVSTTLIEKEVKACLQVAKEWGIKINYMDAAKKLVHYCDKKNKPSDQDIVAMTIFMNKISDNTHLKDSFSPAVLSTLTTAFKQLVPNFKMN